jgi:hypothetical protein
MQSNKNDQPTQPRGRKLFQFRPMSSEAGGGPIEKIGKYGEDQPYMRALNKTVQDERLSAKTLGVLAYLLSLPRNWKVRSDQLAKRFDCGEEAISAAMNELREHGYARLRVVRSPDGTRAAGTIWDVRESPEIPWPVKAKGKSREPENPSLRKPESQKTPPHTNDVLMTNKTKTTNDVPIAKSNSIPASPTKVSSSNFVVENHQHQKQPATQPARDHIKWPEFVAWCEHQKGKRAKDRIHVHDGVPTEDGFWKWLLGQKPKWRNKVKPREYTDGFGLDGKFYTPAEAEQHGLANPHDIVRFVPARRMADGRIIKTKNA